MAEYEMDPDKTAKLWFKRTVGGVIICAVLAYVFVFKGWWPL